MHMNWCKKKKSLLHVHDTLVSIVFELQWICTIWYSHRVYCQGNFDLSNFHHDFKRSYCFNKKLSCENITWMFSTEQVPLEHTEITSIVRCRSINGGLDGKQCSPAWSINYDEFMTIILQVHRCTAWSYDKQYVKNRKTLKIKRAGKKDICDFTQFVTDKNL